MSNPVRFCCDKGTTVAKMKGAFSYAPLIPMPASTPGSSVQRFDYTILDAQTYQFVKTQTGEIRALMKLSFESIIQIGQKLKLVKQQLGHGHFRAWLESEFNWGAWTASKFMQVADRFEGTNFSGLDIAPSALYELAAPSTPEAARDEVLARAKAGEVITYTTAKAVKQKYTSPKAKVEELPAQDEAKAIATLPSKSGSKLEIVAIRPPASKAGVVFEQVPVVSEPVKLIAPSVAQITAVSQQTDSTSVVEAPSALWQLGKRHLLYNGDPNSRQFLEKIPAQVSLMFAFPPSLDWHTSIRAKTRIITTEYLPQGKDVRLFEDMLETSILLYSKVGELVVSCFVPSPELLSIINRQDRYSLFAEPDVRRVNAIITDWKQAGLKVERLG